MLPVCMYSDRRFWLFSDLAFLGFFRLILIEVAQCKGILGWDTKAGQQGGQAHAQRCSNPTAADATSQLLFQRLQLSLPRRQPG